MSKQTRTRRIIASVLAAASVLATGCDGFEIPPPHQYIAPGTDVMTAVTLLERAELHRDLDVADFNIAPRHEPGAKRSRQFRTCSLGTWDVVDDACGVCRCDPRGQVVCLDYLCEPGDDPDPQAMLGSLPPESGEGESCAGEHLHGDSWISACSVCQCSTDGRVECTQMHCEDPSATVAAY